MAALPPRPAETGDGATTALTTDAAIGSTAVPVARSRPYDPSMHRSAQQRRPRFGAYPGLPDPPPSPAAADNPSGKKQQ